MVGAGYDFENMRKRCQAFWEREPTDRPLVAMHVGDWLPVTSYPLGTGALPNGVVTPESLPIDRFVEDNERLYRVHAEAGGDIAWVAVPYWGIPWLEAILGCTVMKSSDVVWSEPWVKDYSELDGVCFSPENPWLKKLLEFTAALVDLSNGRFPVALTLMRGISDLLAALRGPSESVYDLFDHPEQVASLSEGLTGVWIEVANAQMQLIPRFQGGFALGSTWHGWAPGTAGWSQEDAAALWSPILFNQYLLPQMDRIMGNFEFAGVHLHSTTLHPIDQYLTLDSIRLIEINKDIAGPSLPELAPTIWRIQEAGKCVLIWGDFDDNDMEFVRQNLDPCGLCLQIMATSVEHAHHSLEQLSAMD